MQTKTSNRKFSATLMNHQVAEGKKATLFLSFVSMGASIMSLHQVFALHPKKCFVKSAGELNT